MCEEDEANVIAVKYEMSLTPLSVITHGGQMHAARREWIVLF